MSSTRNYFHPLLLLLLLLGTSHPDAGHAAPLRLTHALVTQASGVYINKEWSAHAGDSIAWAQPEFDDHMWNVVDCTLEPGKPRPEGWKGIGWFRRRIDVDSMLVNMPLALVLYQAGACEIYLDGRMIARYGSVGGSGSSEISYQSQNPLPFSFASPGRHVIAVRFSNYSAAAGHASNFYAGFSINIGESAMLSARRAGEIAENLTMRMIFGVVPLTLALLHLILFAFYPRIRANLYYALCMIGFSGIVFAATQGVFAESFAEVVAIIRLSYLAENTAIVFGLLLLYSSASARVPLHGWMIIGAGAVLGLSAFTDLRLVMRIQDVFLVLVIIEMIRGTLFSNGGAAGEGGWIIAVGTGILIITLIFQLLIGYNIIDPIPGLRNGYLYGALALSISMSIYLSRRFAQINENLETQLAQVRALSERTLEQERQAKESEIQQRLLEADNKRKTGELEDARKVQLSMLPVCINDIPGYDICFSMRTATEIGGDYYDYALAPGGTLNVVIGDATGHGMKSALMVASVKSLFSAMGSELGITEFFRRATEIIKDMNLGNLFMSLTFVRMARGEFELSAAGMPPLLLYRASGRNVEHLVIKGMPLGAHRNFPYETKRAAVQPGDILVMMSDGYTELFNSSRAMLEPELIERTIISSAGRTASEIVHALYETGDAWRGAKSQDDDITFVVIKILPVSAA